MKVHKIIFLPLLLAIIVSLDLVTEMEAYIRRFLVLLTLGTILWCIYKHLKDPVLLGKIIITVFLFSATSVLIVLVTLLKTGW